MPGTLAIHVFPGPYLRPSSSSSHSSRSLHDSLAMHSWQNTHVLPGNPYPVISPVVHKVCILDCKSCGTFLTNRGMEAILLLRPNVALYSSDALPVNCSAYTSNPDALRPPTTRNSSSNQVPPRTCECLTQSLCCHGCGTTVGYMIVIPCEICTSSASTPNRTTNGHRFVFHSKEILATDRHYIQDEPGVLSQGDTSHTSEQSSFNPHYESSPAFRPDSYLPTPPLETSSRSFLPEASHSSYHDSFMFPEYATSHEPQFPYSVRPQLSNSQSYTRPSSPGSSLGSDESESDDSSPPPLVSPYPYPYGLPAEHPASPPSRNLKPGDVLYWHHLTRHGEIPGVQDDTRARQKTIPAAKNFVYDR